MFHGLAQHFLVPKGNAGVVALLDVAEVIGEVPKRRVILPINRFNSRFCEWAVPLPWRSRGASLWVDDARHKGEVRG